MCANVPNAPLMATGLFGAVHKLRHAEEGGGGGGGGGGGVSASVTMYTLSVHQYEMICDEGEGGGGGVLNGRNSVT